ncbi:hypothetical protein J7T55_004836 [Diaporthe amygdali]|uniref:uncharacterized protein n=1 Tax=Phomopsis amygdali TaxID=1214568 RepID=UPI0022FE7BD0|nr:uncharacterized protein J7T55_004836 [Diaporthe amygdali]KAJ0114592.1 hypothetical protein J7T55_004836 [Diaporthe amygdali]
MYPRQYLSRQASRLVATTRSAQLPLWSLDRESSHVRRKVPLHTSLVMVGGEMLLLWARSGVWTREAAVAGCNAKGSARQGKTYCEKEKKRRAALEQACKGSKETWECVPAALETPPDKRQATSLSSQSAGDIT